jgi:chromosome segregation ATPase
MKELAEAQKRTEQRVDALTVKMESLRGTEANRAACCALTVKMEELVEAQKRTEQRVDALTVKMEELVEAQKRTEQRVDALTVKMEELLRHRSERSSVLMR